MRKTLWALGVALVLVLATVASSFAQEYWIWCSPLTFTTDDSRLTVSPVGTCVRITTSAAGDLQWIRLGLVLPSYVTIRAVEVCYRLSASSSFISQLRLTRTVEPPIAVVILDDPADLNDPNPQCYTSTAGNIPIDGTITLALRLDFGSPSDWIEIGAIAIQVRGGVSAAPEDMGSPSGLSVGPNYPNPFGRTTDIEYSVPHAGRVELQIFDASGRLVRALLREELPAGGHHATWDGRDDRRRPVESGKYYYQVRAGEMTGSKGMILIQ